MVMHCYIVKITCYSGLYLEINTMLDVVIDVPRCRSSVKRDCLTVTRTWERFPLCSRRKVRNLELKITRWFQGCSGSVDREVVSTEEGVDADPEQSQS